MTPIFALSLVVTIAVVGFLLVVLIQHVRSHDKVDKSTSELSDSVTQFTIDANEDARKKAA